MNAVSNNLKQLRAGANLTQDELAEKLSVTRQTVSSWETGRSEPDLASLQALAEALGVELTELIYGKKEPGYEHMQKRYIRCCVVLGILMLAGLLLRSALRPHLLELKSQYFEIRPYWIWVYSWPPLMFAAAAAFLCSLLSLGLDLRIRKPWNWLALLLGLACLTPALVTAVQCAAWYFAFPGVGSLQMIFPFTFEHLTLVQAVLPFLGGIGIFLGVNRR